MREVANNIALLHKLVGEMNVVAKKLSEAGIKLRIETRNDLHDYLNAAGSLIRLEMALEPMPKESA